jgi:hypothetical protein
MASATRVVGLALGLVGTSHGWYLPGVAPHDFTRGERVELKVNKLTSTRTQVITCTVLHTYPLGSHERPS